MSRALPIPKQSSEVFSRYPANTRRALLALRTLILSVGKQTSGVGELTETRKWGQVSFLPAKTRSGTTLRIDRHRNDAQIALYFHCRSRLADLFRDRFPGHLNIQNNRCIVLDVGQSLPQKPLRECIAMALTYHLRKSQGHFAP